eukprot:scaffold4704_cov116-Isochrysis_galbana.AAC.3
MSNAARALTDEATSRSAVLTRKGGTFGTPSGRSPSGPPPTSSSATCGGDGALKLRAAPPAVGRGWRGTRHQAGGRPTVALPGSGEGGGCPRRGAGPGVPARGRRRVNPAQAPRSTGRAPPA